MFSYDLHKTDIHCNIQTTKCTTLDTRNMENGIASKCMPSSTDIRCMIYENCHKALIFAHAHFVWIFKFSMPIDNYSLLVTCMHNYFKVNKTCWNMLKGNTFRLVSIETKFKSVPSSLIQSNLLNSTIF